MFIYFNMEICVASLTLGFLTLCDSVSLRAVTCPGSTLPLASMQSVNLAATSSHIIEVILESQSILSCVYLSRDFTNHLRDN